MKIKYEPAKHPLNQNYFKIAYRYYLESSILKTHFKELMRLTTLRYDSKSKTGLINEENKDAFLALVEKIEASNDKRCQTSHEKSKIAAKKRFDNRNCEHEDLGSMGYKHGSIVKCPFCEKMAVVW